MGKFQLTKKNLIFPGQGSQKVGMGLDLYNNYKLAKEYFDLANKIMGKNISEICFNGPNEELKLTENTQPGIFIIECILFDLINKKEIEPEYVAGHSLGEYSALYAADIFDFETGLILVKTRSLAMKKAGEQNSGSMAAIIGLDSDELIKICDSISNVDDIVVPANFNSPSQIVISGTKTAVKKTMGICKEMGAKKTIELNVSGAFHSPLMKEAKNEMKEKIEKLKFKTPRCPIIMNVTGEETIDENKIKINLINQLDHPVRWLETINRFNKLGIRNFIEVGPNKVLRGLNNRINSEINTINIENSNHVEEIKI
tara:strand:+ start:830 stop:1771 length:942 start_codon:yes stop_codon:yes gene_type:complete